MKRKRNHMLHVGLLGPYNLVANPSARPVCMGVPCFFFFLSPSNPHLCWPAPTQSPKTPQHRSAPLTPHPTATSTSSGNKEVSFRLRRRISQGLAPSPAAQRARRRHLSSAPARERTLGTEQDGKIPKAFAFYTMSSSCFHRFLSLIFRVVVFTFGSPFTICSVLDSIQRVAG